MINGYQIQAGVLVNESKFKEAQWIDLSNPNSDELIEISSELDLPLDFLMDALDPAERPHMYSDNPNWLIILKIPLQSTDDKETEMPINTVPVGIILKENQVITVCKYEETVRQLLSIKTGSHSFPKGISLVLTLMQQSSIKYIKYLLELDKYINKIEERMVKSMRNEELYQMLQIDKVLIYFLTSLKGNAAVMDKIAATPSFCLDESEHDLLVDAIIECKQATEMTDVYSHVVSSVSDTVASIISNNMNNVVRLLTYITVVLMIPTIIAGVYGMNIVLPFQDYPYAFWLITGLTSFACVGVWVYLIKKKWT